MNSYYDDEDDEAVDCSEYGKVYQHRTDLENKKCSAFAIDGYQCVPFYACKGGEVITSGASILSTRHSGISGTLDQLFDPLDSKCDDLQEICCRMPDWKDVPPENPIIIKKPPIKCSKRNTDLQNGTCFYRNVMYQDLDGMPSSDCCNTCFCDFGKRLAWPQWWSFSRCYSSGNKYV